jgi:hypothetical protein
MTQEGPDDVNTVDVGQFFTLPRKMLDVRMESLT